MLEKICHSIIKYSTIIILVPLTLFSLFSTQRYGIEAMGEIINGAPIYKISDNFFLHIIGILLLVSFFCIISRTDIDSRSLTQIRVFQLMLSICGFAFSLLLYSGNERTPINDQIQVYGAALTFNEGNYINLSEGGYISMYPQQLGYVLFLQTIFKLFPSGDYGTIQYINCFLIVFVLLAMHQFINDVIKEPSIRVIASCFTSLSMPLYFLHSWVYGDLPFLLFTFLFLHFVWSYLQNASASNICGALTCACLMLIFRKNALIILLAAFLALCVDAVSEKKYAKIIFSLGILTLPLVLFQLLLLYYQYISGYTDLRGLPGTCWIAMGLIEDASKPGWFNNFGVSTYYDNSCNWAQTNSDATAMIFYRLQDFVSDPGMALSFWKRKICTQWNDPFFNTLDLLKTNDGSNTTFLTNVLLQNHMLLLTILSVLQSLSYLGSLFYIVLKKHTCVATRIPEITFLGGFLFSLLWEANSRYVYPYYLIMIPVAIMGWRLLLKKLRLTIQHKKRP